MVASPGSSHPQYSHVVGTQHALVVVGDPVSATDRAEHLVAE